MLDTVTVPKQLEPLFALAQEYVRKYFQAQKIDPTKGTIEISGERYILVRAASMSVEFFETLARLYGREGQDQAYNIARQLLFDIAHAIGKQDAKSFQKKMGLEDPVAKLSAGPTTSSTTTPTRSSPLPGCERASVSGFPFA
jgi:two-component system cell cycle sensor histidine kinase/response regulator CckA